MSPKTDSLAIDAWSQPLPPPRGAESRWRQPPAPAREERKAGQAEGEHDCCARRRHDPTRVAEKQRPVQIGQPAFERGRAGAADRLARRRVDDSRGWLAGIFIIDGDPA